MTKELKHSSVAVNVPNCVSQKQKLLQISVKFMTISFSATSYIKNVIYKRTCVVSFILDIQILDIAMDS